VQEVPPGSPDQVRRLGRYRQEHPDVRIEPPGVRSAVWRAFRDGDLIAYGFTLMVFLERLEALPEPLAAAHDLGRRPCGMESWPGSAVPGRPGRAARYLGLRAACPRRAGGVPGNGGAAYPVVLKDVDVAQSLRLSRAVASRRHLDRLPLN